MVTRRNETCTFHSTVVYSFYFPSPQHLCVHYRALRQSSSWRSTSYVAPRTGLSRNTWKRYFSKYYPTVFTFLFQSMIHFKRHDAGKRQAVELTRPRPPPGRAPGNTTRTYELRQANPGLALRRCPRLR